MYKREKNARLICFFPIKPFREKRRLSERIEKEKKIVAPIKNIQKYHK
jgi:hypothetical protein